MFKIDSGVPAPMRKTNSIIETLKETGVGDSFLIPNSERGNINYARVWCSNNGISIATRKTDAGIRIWRLE